VRLLDPEALDARTLAGEVRALLRSSPAPVELDLDGARASAELLWRMAADRNALDGGGAVA
jgi:predicted glycosyltransferase